MFAFFVVSAALALLAMTDLVPAVVGEVCAGRLSAVSLALARAAGPVRGAHRRRRSQHRCAGSL